MRRYLYVAVFFSGMASLGIEMAASRLLGNYFGSSNLVWASIIGLILIYLTVGYFLGGSWADRSPHFSTLYRILIWAAFATGLVPLVSRPVLRLAASAFDQLQLGILFGSFVSVMILFIIPTVLLGMASPFAIRLALEDAHNAGLVSGRIYAISTLGSFVGTFLPVLVLTPIIGTFQTFLAFSALLLVIALYGLLKSAGGRALLPYAWMPFVLILISIYGTQGTDKTTRGQIYETESSYNYIQVLQDGDYRLLRLNEGQGVHSIYHPTELFYQGPWEQVLVGPFFNNPPYALNQVKKMAIVGLAAGTTARQASIVFPGIQIDGFEIDPKIVDVGRKYFGMDEPNLHVFVQDGRVGLANSVEQYQVISVDAYRPPYIPPHMVTQEFFQIAHDHLTQNGVMVINVGRGPNDRRLIDSLSSTILTIFPTVHVMDIPGTFNSIIFATVSPTASANLASNFLYLAQPGQKTPMLLLQAMQVAVKNLQPQPQPATIFTDDKAPIEWMTNNLILSFLFSGDAEKMK